MRFEIDVALAMVTPFNVEAAGCVSVKLSCVQNALHSFLYASLSSMFLKLRDTHTHTHTHGERLIESVTSCVRTVFLKHIIGGKIGVIEVKERRGRRRKQLLNDLKETIGY
jgi:hypothetical protein